MKKYIGLSLLALSMGLASCNDFLDKLPDNRTEANSEVKIQKLLVAAYPTHDHMAFTEYASDNVDDMGEKNPYTDRFLDQLYSWTDVTETDNQDPESYWMDLYQCIETANMALEGIESMGGATTTTLKEMQAEALLCRAYAHFMLVNIFAMHYDANNPNAIGVSYVTETEKELNPQYQRETVHENYAHIAADLEAALPNVGDSYYTVPKYHFNKNAAYAFASRFYLYYEKYDKCIEYSTKLLGSNPKTMLRNNQYIASLPRDWNNGEAPIALFYVDANQTHTTLLLTSYSNQPINFGPYYTGKRYSHNAYIGTNETVNALAALWGGTYTSYKAQVFRYSGTNLNAWLNWHMPYLFEYTDPVAGIGYRHTVYNAFTTDEVLINRAEAYAMLKQYDKACEDLTIWIRNTVVAQLGNFTLTPDMVTDFMASMDYAYDDEDHMASSLKKHLHPKFAIEAEGSLQESMIQLILAVRRYETLLEGKRWFDIKRWGIEIPRHTMTAGGAPASVSDWLKVDDPRRAIQIPQKVREAGYEPNPRPDNNDTNGALIPDNNLLKD